MPRVPNSSCSERKSQLGLARIRPRGGGEKTRAQTTKRLTDFEDEQDQYLTSLGEGGGTDVMGCSLLCRHVEEQMIREQKIKYGVRIPRDHKQAMEFNKESGTGTDFTHYLTLQLPHFLHADLGVFTVDKSL